MSTDKPNVTFIAISHDKYTMAEYFNLDPDISELIFERIKEIVLTQGHHTMVDDLKCIDEEYTDIYECNYAKFCYGIQIGMILTSQYSNHTEGGVN